MGLPGFVAEAALFSRGRRYQTHALPVAQAHSKAVIPSAELALGVCGVLSLLGCDWKCIDGPAGRSCGCICSEGFFRTVT